MNCRFKPLAFPKVCGVDENLDEKPDSPKHAKPKRNLFTKAGRNKFLGGGQAKYTHQKNGDGNEEGMYSHHLPVNQA
ncbi:hypothetical protein [Rufibacter roseus]|uniref:Uncharacterized protein n=1 Tax=Rufibacter roseus TaxID=1567108 RepID=A0ABW2DJ21_9BACT|nr:hypothetical protein [Rufibacter roseus]